MSPSSRRFDPGRRQRILDATLEVVAQWGVVGTTHRRVAEAADVPLGSMTYHFAGIEPLLTEAFTQWAHTIADHFLVVLSAARTPAEAQAAVVDIVIGTQWATPLNLLLSHELYAHGARHPAMKQVMRNWMARSREALERHFDPLTARALDAFIEGMTLHHAVDPWPGGRAGVEEMVGRLCGSAQAARL